MVAGAFRARSEFEYAEHLPHDGIGLPVDLPAHHALAVGAGAFLGGLIGKFNKHRIDSGIETKVGETIGKGTAGIITLVKDSDTAAVKGVLGESVKMNVVSVEGDGINELKEGIALANIE